MITDRKRTMWSNKHDLARKALLKALDARSREKLEITDAVAVYDASERLGIDEVRFVNVPSLEELYSKTQRKILISSHRPAGRQAFNCAHGLGHHVFGHGMCITAINDGARNSGEFEPNEFLADTFAGFFLMPKTSVCHAFACRGWEVGTCTPVQVYIVASWLGVGYTTLIHHMCSSLRLISPAYAARLRSVSLSTIKMHVLGGEARSHLIMVDRHWTGRALDTCIGDIIVASQELSSFGPGFERVRECRYGSVYIPTLPGCGVRLLNASNGDFLAVRIARGNYCGRNLFRFEEDPDYEEQPAQLY